MIAFRADFNSKTTRSALAVAAVGSSTPYISIICVRPTSRRSARVQTELQLLLYNTPDVFGIYRFLFKPLGNV